MINYGESEKLVSQHITNGDTDAAEIQKSYYYRYRYGYGYGYGSNGKSASKTSKKYAKKAI